MPVVMNQFVRAGVRWGAAVGSLLIVGAVAFAFTGPEPAGGGGERIMGVSILLTRAGFPLTYALLEFIDAFGVTSWVLAAALPLTLACVLVNWAVIGGSLGWVVGAVRRFLIQRKESHGSRPNSRDSG